MMMRFLTGFSFLLMVALAFAAPRSNTIYRLDQEEEELTPIAVDLLPQDSYSFTDQDDYDKSDNSDEDNIFGSNPFSSALDLNFHVNDGMPPLVDDTVNNLIFKDLEKRIAEDVRRMREDLLLFQRLFGPIPTFPYLYPWAAPEDQPAIIPDGSESSDNIPGSNTFFKNNNDDDDDGDNDDDFNLFNGFPLLGIDRPMFPGYPQLPGVGFANPEDFPENYNNKTYEVHDVNGTLVAVNNTINKASGDNFNSFFHHQVIHFRPEEEEVTEETFESSTVVPDPASEAPQENEGENDDEINSVLPEVDNEINSTVFNPEAIPEVKPEASVNPELDGSRTETYKDNRVLPGNLKSELRERSLREFNPIVFPGDDPNVEAIAFPGPKSAAFIAFNSLSDEERDFEEIDASDKGTKAPDLSNDTRVNRVHANKQGMVQVDPDAEIFNYELVMRESRPRTDDK